VEIVARLRSGETIGDRVLKVDHADEHGAVNIYRGQQLACRWRDAELRGMLAELRAQEAHRALFAAELSRRGRRCCRSDHLCSIGGFCLGLVTGICGRASIAAATVAVERVVLTHLHEQIHALRAVDPPACAAIEAIVRDEQSHHDKALPEPRKGIFWPRVLLPVISWATESVIWVGMRL
jgi:ubiquinone biosynthesis monooxygenase Coq7